MESIPPDYCRGGFNKLADSRFEKPTTFTSSGIFNDILLQTLFVVSASFSTEANIPVGGFAEFSKFLINWILVLIIAWNLLITIVMG